MKQIPLTQGKVALVDDTDYEHLNQWNWYAHKNRTNFYAVRHSPIINGKNHLIRMHRQILGLKYRDRREADHINHITLDNRQCNIRICTHQQNRTNTKPDKNGISLYKGVSWSGQYEKWRTRIQINGKEKFLGYWDIEEVAALTYDMVAIRVHGKFAYLNFN